MVGAFLVPRSGVPLDLVLIFQTSRSQVVNHPKMKGHIFEGSGNVQGKGVMVGVGRRAETHSGRSSNKVALSGDLCKEEREQTRYCSVCFS